MTTTVQRELKFPPYQDVLNFDVNTPIFQKKMKRTGPGFILLRILQKFRETHNRDPSYKSRDEDLKQLESIRNDLCSSDILDSNYFESLFSQISPAVAVVGGVLAQEIIKVVTKKEAPHCNIFLFDPQTCCGYVEAICTK